jgi:hypothetical protein
MVYPTEFAFTLPKGLLDSEGQIHRNGTMRLATARDEILPLQDSRVRNNRAYLVVLLLSRVVTRLGALEGDEITPSVIESLFSADLSYLQSFYRQINEAGSAALEAECPKCATRFSLASTESAPAILAS